MQDVHKKLEEMFKFFDVLYRFQSTPMNDTFKRNFLRFFFIQVDNFLKYMPYYKNALFRTNTIGVQEKKSLENKIKKLRTDYDGADDVIRDKFSAHQQEVTFENIIEWYNEIDASTIGVFHGDIKAIKNELEILLNSQFQVIPNIDEINLSNTELKKDISSFNVNNSRLGLIEKNTVYMLSVHPLQTKHQIILAIIDSIRDNFLGARLV
ncbi:MAG TPA: hypothetical protein EYP33_02760 [Pyrodictium sp.]|nr:hypothetical protein [Pyrodictium sp.]